MIYTINDKVCKDYGLEVEELLAFLLVKSGIDIEELLNKMSDKQMVVKKELFNSYRVTQHWDDIVSSILLDSDKDKPSPDRIEQLAPKLMEVFPKCKKEGTCHYFRGNKKDISLRLKKFFKLYGDKYTDEQIINAAKQYVESFNGNYNYMRILKYFIWKDERKVNSEGSIYVEETSDLASCIENEGQEASLGNDWNTELI